MLYVSIEVTGGGEAPSAEQKVGLIHDVIELLSCVLNKNPETTVVVIDEIDMDNWGVGSKSVTVRRAEARNKQTLAA